MTLNMLTKERKEKVTTVNKEAMNSRVHASFQVRVFVFSGCVPKSKIAESIGSSIFSS